ncbi:MAG: glycosyltransferase family 2 protein [Lachnospiraceae bacterium]|nr:glycosyltransferase family 2 protein [Lachnospiraceae bacterium]
MDYKEAYEKEHLKNAALAERVAELEDANGDLQFKIDRIKNNPLWKVSKPARDVMHIVQGQAQRLKNCGGPKGVAAKIDYKKREKEAMKQFGTASFPNEARAKAERETAFSYRPLISILVPLYNTDSAMLKEMIDSVENQTYENWQLCLADGSDADHASVGQICAEYVKKERQQGRDRVKYQVLVKNEGISGNTNECLKLADGEYIGLLDHDDVLHPSVLYEYVKAINEKGADYLYCDEATFQSGDINHMLTMHFKPDYAPDNLRANNYICHFSVFKRSLLEGTELFRPRFDGSQDHDMILRLTDRAQCIVHVPKLMYYWRCHPASTASNIGAKTYAIEAARNAVADHLRSHGYQNFKITSTRAFETIFKIRYEIQGNPKISIVIANKDHEEDLRRCITSIYEKSTYDNWEIIVVENGSTEEGIYRYYRELMGLEKEAPLFEEAAASGDKSFVNAAKNVTDADAKTSPQTCLTSPDGKIHIVRWQSNGAFNYSAVNNYGASFATGEYILLLNNDTEVITVNWLEELLMYAQREDVGAVGAKLYYPDKTIQHAGVVLQLGAHRTAGHSHYKQPKQNLGYMGRLCYAQDVSAVTGACLLVKKSLFDQVGGLDESFAISLNDVDFCLKLRARGYLNVFTPFAELTHYESASRGLDDNGEKAERYNRESEHFRTKWKEVLEAGDPYYNPNFSLDRSDFSLRISENEKK